MKSILFMAEITISERLDSLDIRTMADVSRKKVLDQRKQWRREYPGRRTTFDTIISEESNDLLH